MSPDPSQDVAQVLSAISAGDQQAASDLLPVVYEELQKLAHHKLTHEPRGHTLQTTALVHEAYVRLVGHQDPGWDGRGHFFAAAAEAMRRILIERARRRGRLKHGAGYRRFEMTDAAASEDQPPVDVLALDEALQRLEAYDHRKSEIVKLRFFGGLTVEETAAALAVSPATVKSDWSFARAWLHRELSRGDTTTQPARESDPTSPSSDICRME
jgi:RNA polymerase sigma factor (TIGR02999 family)